MSKKILSVILALTLLVGCAIPAYAALNDTGFADVDAGAWYAGAVEYCRDNNLMSGTGNNNFSPNNNMSRAMLATVLYRIAGEPQVDHTNPFTDVPAGQWYTDGILWAQQNHIVSGYGNGRFGTNDPITREQIAAILWRYEGRPEVGKDAEFTDAAQISSYALEAVDWARANGIVNGKGNNCFDPQGNATRAEVATMLMNYHKLVNETPAPTPSRQIVVQAENGSVVYELNDSPAADSLYEQLPITIPVEDYSTNEKIFYPPQSLDTSGTPQASDGAGTLAYYAPWGDVVMFYGDYSQNSSLFELGRVVSGSELVSGMSGTITVRRMEDNPAPEPDDTPKVLVAYFSATNTTEGVAQRLADSIGAVIYEIVPQVPYTSADLNYSNSDCRANQEQNDPSVRPAISGSVNDMSQYDVVFIGYPIWWGQAPKIISTFLESYDFSGTTIVPFCTSGSSPIGSSATNLQSLASGADWLDGRRFSGSISDTELAAWVNGLGLDITIK